jgi:hypothetical protein
MVAINGKSFIANLLCVTSKGEGEVDFLRSSDAAGSGWLVQGTEGHGTLSLQFDFVEQQDNRLHYRISGAPGTQDYAGARLGVSRNGYVGFYDVLKIHAYWKIEPLFEGSEPDYFEFHLRDSRGYRVGTVREHEGSFWTGLDGPLKRKVNFLNVEDGSIAVFGAIITRYL